ncbi:MAG: thioredoxin domain-containing protein [Armatimonadetes bacterium]|nr:thioredoxin domain-containing protein [Armatimonadota bacterium]
MSNRLGEARSPYLRAAAHQPVAWHPWSDEAFARARAEDKPILLDIGATWCHWCHVMDHESYDDAEVAEILNRHFVSIKVDRDERPDIDIRYQNAVSALSGQGGWPLTAFLTPDGQVFYGGTYFPKEDGYGRPGFKRILLSVAETYHRERGKTLEFAAKLAADLKRAQVATEKRPLAPAQLDALLDEIARAFDIRNGGFGVSPKFPHPSAIDLVLRRWAIAPEDWLRTIFERTLSAMGRGGIHDHIGGGFHRYSVDARWIVPHFEKMLYDNAPLLTNYARAWQAVRDPFYRDVANGIVTFLFAVLGDPAGGFAASQDADLGPGDDGDYFTWSLDEARAVLTPEELAVASLRFDIGAHGEMHHDPSRNVLFLAAEAEDVARCLAKTPAEVDALIASAVTKMRQARDERTAPFVDRTLYANWNGMAAHALLVAHQALADRRLLDAALRTLDRFLGEAYRASDGFAHALAEPDGSRTVDDQVQMGLALLLAFQATREARYLAVAEEIAQLLDREYRDTSEGGYFDVPRSRAAGPALEVPYKPLQDAPTAGANAVAALFLQDLAVITGDATWQARAEEVLTAFAGPASRQGYFASKYHIALSRHLGPGAHIMIVGGRDDPEARGLFEAAWHAFHPDKIVTWSAPGERVPEPVAPMIARAAGKPAAFVCVGTRCLPPVGTPEALAAALSGLAPAATA